MTHLTGGWETPAAGKYLNPPAMETYCRDGGTPSHPINSGEFQRLPGWDHQLTMCITEYYNVTWNLNGTEYCESAFLRKGYQICQSTTPRLGVGGR